VAHEAALSELRRHDAPAYSAEAERNLARAQELLHQDQAPPRE
jgi:hypothetical protein